MDGICNVEKAISFDKSIDEAIQSLDLLVGWVDKHGLTEETSKALNVAMERFTDLHGKLIEVADCVKRNEIVAKESDKIVVTKEHIEDMFKRILHNVNVPLEPEVIFYTDGTMDLGISVKLSTFDEDAYTKIIQYTKDLMSTLGQYDMLKGAVEAQAKSLFDNAVINLIETVSVDLVEVRNIQVDDVKKLFLSDKKESKGTYYFSF